MVIPGEDPNKTRAQNDKTVAAQSPNQYGNQLWYGLFLLQLIFVVQMSEGFVTYSIFSRKNSESFSTDSGWFMVRRPFSKKLPTPSHFSSLTPARRIPWQVSSRSAMLVG
jgi:hypothetical protein